VEGTLLLNHGVCGKQWRGKIWDHVFSPAQQNAAFSRWKLQHHSSKLVFILIVFEIFDMNLF